MKISICIPMYNEEKIVVSCAKAITEEMESYCEKAGDEYEIIFSDDGSTDASVALLPSGDNLHFGRIKACLSDHNTGKGGAVRRAVAASSGDAVLYTDCDLAYGTAVIPEAVDLLKNENIDAVAGSRAIHPDGYAAYGIFRRIASKVYMTALKLIAGFSMTDSQCGFKLFSGELARRIFSVAECDGWAFDFEIFLLAEKEKAVIREMPVKIINHRESHIHMISDSINMICEFIKIKRRIKKRR